MSDTIWFNEAKIGYKNSKQLPKLEKKKGNRCHRWHKRVKMALMVGKVAKMG